MYRDEEWHCEAEEVQQCRALLTQLDLRPGPGGSYISGPTNVFASFILRWYPAAWQTRVVVLYPSAQIVAHSDAPIRGIRTHIPLQLNPGCWVFHDSVWQQLREGSVYQMDPTIEHGAVNWGATPRFHLIIDREN